MRTIADEARSSHPPAATQGQRVHAPRLRWALVGLIGMVAFWGSVGGWSFITDPTGAGLRARLAWLERTPVDDFLIPGWYLFLAYGVGGLLVIVGLLRRTRPDRCDAWMRGSVSAGPGRGRWRTGSCSYCGSRTSSW
ncbi:MAG: hypothetical protein U0V56_11695 [Actinomycetota bacterium]